METPLPVCVCVCTAAFISIFIVYVDIDKIPVGTLSCTRLRDLASACVHYRFIQFRICDMKIFIIFAANDVTITGVSALSESHGSVT